VADAVARVFLRTAEPGDLAAARALLEASGLPLDGVEDQFGPAYVVGEAGGRLVGIAGMEVYGDCGLLRSVAVDRALRGTGVGVRLVEDRLAWARNGAVRAVYLLTTTAAVFFTRFGFQEVERTTAPVEMQASPEFAAACPGSAVCMRLDLTP
jgi:amino-acid N-acetyltransferase